MAFAHLHVHTEYSLLDGSNKIKEYVSRVKKLGMNSAAITDHGVMYGVIDFYREARANGIKPIIGCEVYVAPNSRFDREVGGGEDRYYHLVLLAENNTGYANLMKIVSRGFTEGFYYKPRVDMEVLNQFHEGIIALSACLAGEVQRYISKGLYAEACKAARKYEACFGKDNFFLELQDHGLAEQKKVNTELLRMSKELGIPLVATNDVHYTYKEDVDSHDILLCLQTGKKLTDTDRMRYEGGQYFVKSEEEMKGLFPYAWEAVENTQIIADRCNVEIEFGVTKLPKYDVPEGYTSWTYLNKLCTDGLSERYGKNLPEGTCVDDLPAGTTGQTLRERLDYELGVIQKMGYVDYFLIVWDFINYAKSNGIPVGPGRGSAAGSIVSYCLKITNIDPIRYNLLFERFLNPERVSMPDIDIDFCYNRRQEVIDYVGRKYGSDKVVQIVTFGTMAAKGVLRDVGRVMDLSYSFVDSIAKMVPNELNITLDRALEMNPEMRKLYAEDMQVKQLIDMSRRLEGKSHKPEKISFKYLKHTIDDMSQQVERRKGEKYTVSPHQLLISDGNYYLLAYVNEKQKMHTYRIDRMKDVSLTGEPREGEDEFAKLDVRTYAQRVFGMYGGTQKRVTIQFINPLLDTAIERFGVKDVQYSKVDDRHFKVTANVEISDQFYGWLLGFGKRAKLTWPDDEVEKFKAYLDKVRNAYE